MNLKIIASFFVSCIIMFNLQAQTPGWQWVQGGGGGGFPGSNPSNPSPDYVYGSALDRDDNLIVGGVTSWTSKFDTIQFGTNTNWQNANFFLTKYDKCGSVLWARVGGGDAQDYIEGVDVDDAGNIYVIGALNATGIPCYINTPLKDTVLYNCTRFFAKFDTHGNLSYVKTYTSTASFDYGMFKRLKNGLFLGVLTKGSGSTTTFDGFQINPVTRNFVIFDSLGNAIKVATIDSNFQAGTALGKFVLDENDNIYFAVSNINRSVVKYLSNTYNPAPLYTAFLFKTDTSFLVKKDNVTGYYQETLAYLSYSNGFLYASGRNIDGAVFDTDTTHTTLSMGKFTAFKIDTNLSLVWSSRPTIQSVNPTYTKIIPGSSVDNLYLAYQHRGNVTWDSASINLLANTSGLAMLRLRTSDGVCIEGHLATGGNSSKDAVEFIHTGSNGDANLIGSYANYIGIPGDSIYAQGGVNSPDFFILKWGLPCSDTLNSLDRPDAPANLVATATGTQTIHVSWSDATEYEQGYRIYRSPDGINNWAQVGTAGNNVTTYNDGNLTPATTYWYRAAAYNSIGESGFTNIDSATTFSGQCSAVVSYTQNDSVYTFTVATTGTPGYTYQWSVNGNNTSTGATANVVIANAGTYNVCVSVTDGNQCISNSCQTITISGIEDWNTLNVALYPNPTSGLLYLNIDATEAFAADMIISDMLGRVMLQRKITLTEGSNTERINGTDWDAGRYNIRLVSASGGVWSKGVVKY